MITANISSGSTAITHLLLFSSIEIPLPFRLLFGSDTLNHDVPELQKREQGPALRFIEPWILVISYYNNHSKESIISVVISIVIYFLIYFVIYNSDLQF